VLRDSDADSEAPREPSPGIRDVDQLVAGIEETGLIVHLERVGDPETVPADVGLAVYRVIQESLTNVSRHARASEVQVTIDRRPQEVLVRIEDNGVGFVGSTPDGHGIVGMRERLRLLGGHLDVGPAQNGGGLAIEGHIPLGEDR
jgi:signal transduction histidine kinase